MLLTALAVGGFSRPLRRPGPRLTRPAASSRMALETLPGGLSIAEAVGMRIESLFVAAPMAVAMVATRSSSSIPQVVELARGSRRSVVAAKWGARLLRRRGGHLSAGHHLAAATPCMLVGIGAAAAATSRASRCCASPTAPTARRRRVRAAVGEPAQPVAQARARRSGAGRACVLVSRLPPRRCRCACLRSTPLAVSSYAVQALEAYRMGSSDSANRTYAIAPLAGLAHPHRHDHPPSGGDRGAGEPRDRVHWLLGAAPSARPLRRARAVEARRGARLLRARRAAQPAGAAGRRREHAHAWRLIGGFGGEAAGRLRRAAQPRRVRRHRRRRRRLHLAPELTTAVLRAVETEDARSLSTRASVQQLVFCSSWWRG